MDDAIGPDAIRAFAEQINRGKQYVEAWRKYEKELAEWQGKQAEAAPAPAPAPAATPTPESAPVDPVSGVWEAELDIQGQLQLLIRGEFLVDAQGLHRVTGRPFTIAEIEKKILEMAD